MPPQYLETSFSQREKLLSFRIGSERKFSHSKIQTSGTFISDSFVCDALNDDVLYIHIQNNTTAICIFLPRSFFGRISTTTSLLHFCFGFVVMVVVAVVDTISIGLCLFFSLMVQICFLCALFSLIAS